MNTHEQETLDLDITPVPSTRAKIPAQRDPTPAPAPARPMTNDMNLVEDVIRLATEPGYVLIGTGERVWRHRLGRDRELERVPDYEDAAVHQLLTAHLLTRGRTVTASYQRYEGRAVAVTVPASTRQTALRWRAYLPHPPTGGNP
jgi:hypothetical protein